MSEELIEYVEKVVSAMEPSDIVPTNVKSSRLDSYDGGNNIWAPDQSRSIDSYSLKNLFFAEDWVYIAVNNVATKISDQRLRVVEVNLVNGQVVKTPAEDHELQRLLDFPNSEQDQHTWLYNKTADLTMMGNNIDWFNDGELWQVPAERVTITFKDCGEIESYNVSGQDESDTICETRLDPDDVIHTRKPNPSNVYWGLSPFIPGGKSVLFNRYSSEYLNNFYLKGATPQMALEMGTDVNEKSALRLLRSFEMAYTGRRNQRRTLLAPKGVKVSPITPSLADQQLKDYIDKNRETIINLLAIPKSELSLQDSGSLGSQETRLSLKNYWETTLLPTMGLIEGALNKFFKDQLEPNFKIEFNLTGIDALRDDKLKTAELADRLIKSGAWTLNEVRAELYNKDALDGGDESLLTVGRGRQEQPPPAEEPSERPRDDEPTREAGEVTNKADLFIETHKAYWDDYLEKKFQAEALGQQDMKVLTLNVYAAFFKDAMPRIVEDLKKATGQKQSIAARLRKFLKSVFDDFEEEYTDRYEAINGPLAQFGYTQALQTPNFNNRDAQAIAQLENTETAQKLLKTRGIKSFESIKDTEVTAVMDTITRGLKEGKTVAAISEEVGQRYLDPARPDGRSDKVATTEVGVATMVGKDAAQRDINKVIDDDFKVTKTWIAVLDGRTRDSHLPFIGVHGETVDRDKRFSNGMRYPLDPSGPPEERINCRCDMILNIEEK